jgi:methylmalonyl-CoA mutase
MRAEPEELASGFETPDPARWEALVAKLVPGGVEALVKRTHDRLEIRPLYLEGGAPPIDDGRPGAPPFVRGARPATAQGWEVRTRIAHPDPAVANRIARDELAYGAEALVFALDDRIVLDGEAPSGGLVYAVDELEELLAGLPLGEVPILLQPGWRYGSVAALLVAHLRRRGRSLAMQAPPAVLADPLGTVALGVPLDMDAAIARLVELLQWDARHETSFTLPLADGTPYHGGGASTAQELACAMGTALAYLKALDEGGMPPETVAPRIAFRLATDTDVCLNIAKLRAARLLWHRITEACGASARGMHIWAQTAERIMSRRDVHVNLLRGTAACFAAAAGGAEAITVLPFDHALGQPTPLARRLARSTQLILREESGLHRVADPAGGAWFVEDLTRTLAREAWSLFQMIESGGGMAAMLMRGSIQDWIAELWSERAAAVARRAEPITGVSAFPDLDERVPEPDPCDVPGLVRRARSRLREVFDTREVPFDAVIEAAAAGRSLIFRGPAGGITPVVQHRLGEAFEELRDASDAWLAKHGRRPCVFLCRLGEPEHCAARAGRATALFASGGIEAIASPLLPRPDGAGFAFRRSGCAVAVLCSSDALYAEQAAEAARLLRAAGAREVWMLEAPEDLAKGMKRFGVTRNLGRGDDATAHLAALLHLLGEGA